MPTPPTKVAIIGGGMAGLATAFELSQSRQFDITIYQLGWRLGGKCASGRNSAKGNRIEEHGLHVWFGCYHQAFQMLAHCYDELGLGDVLLQFTGTDVAPIMDCRDGSTDCQARDWEVVPIRFPRREGRPGDRIPAVDLSGVLTFLWAFVTDCIRDTFPGVKATSVGVLTELETYPVAGSVADRAGWLVEQLPEILERIGIIWKDQPADAIDARSRLRLIRAAVALAMATMVGLAQTRPQRLSDLDDEDLRNWLSRRLPATLQWALASAPVRALYDLCFAYPGGDTATPGNFAAGAALNAVLRIAFYYRGPSVLYQMKGGMGDIVAAPMYRCLERRGVRFKFFHRLEDVLLGDTGTVIDGLRFSRQAAPSPTTGEYDPLDRRPAGPFRDIGCWPHEPLFDRLQNGNTLQRDQCQFESRWKANPHATAVELRRGADFDEVVLAIPPDELRLVTGALAVRPEWRNMLNALETVQTMGVQLWMTKDAPALGWQAGAAPVDAAPESIDVWSDRSEVLPLERHGRGVRSLWYGCGPLPGNADLRNQSAPDDAHRRALAMTVRYVGSRGLALWPSARTGDGTFDWSVLADDSGSDGGARVGAQFVRANIEPTERYVLSVAGSTRLRLRPDSSGFENLALAGDWTAGDWNAGCVEAAVESGVSAARALLGRHVDASVKSPGDEPQSMLKPFFVRTSPKSGRSLGKRVLILGGGVGGLSAAHELCCRGYSVEVVEQGRVVGGKARSIYVDDSAAPGRGRLPGEHGFRFFPGFYQHLTDTMSRIPFADSARPTARSVADNLVSTSIARISRIGQSPIDMPVHLGGSVPLDVVEALDRLMHVFSDTSTGLTRDDVLTFGGRMWKLMTMCPERAEVDLERESWWQFMGADNPARSESYRRLLVTALTRTLVAAKAKEAAARPGGVVLTQLLYNALRPGSSADRVLNGPTSEVWLEPWHRHLDSKHVRFRLCTTVQAINVRNGRIESVIVRPTTGIGAPTTLDADHYVAAVPVEVMSTFLNDDLCKADPTLEGIKIVGEDVEWMNGVLFFLNRVVPIVRGHVTYIDSAWALTSISQAQFWPGGISPYGAGRVRDILSVVVSNWEEARELDCPSPDECREAVTREVWRQITESVNSDGDVLTEEMLVRPPFIDPAIAFEPQPRTNRERLLVNKKCRWRLRPHAYTAVPNLFLASDYVRTNTNLATMEAANEAARRAVNAILARDGRMPDVEVRELYVPPILAPFQQLDCAAYRRGAAWTPPALPRSGFRMTRRDALVFYGESDPLS